MIRVMHDRPASGIDDDARWLLQVGDRVFAVPERGLVLGRSLDAAIRLKGGLVSREHARVSLAGGALAIDDLGSRNGVLVNDKRIGARMLLRHGDVVTIGVENIVVIDAAMGERPAHLSTMLPPSAVRTVAPGEADFDGAEEATVAANVDVLTARERQVLELVVLGHTQAEIAKQLYVSVKTVETHRARIADKLECRTRAEMVSFALSAGIFERLRPRR